jgi:hypothetical protein
MLLLVLVAWTAASVPASLLVGRRLAVRPLEVRSRWR